MGITHDPYAEGMSDKYGAPGQTDNEGFDPYADTVGPGIYGGDVKRDPKTGEVVIGRQYQNHNPRPGPVYSGKGYTAMSQALKRGEQAIAALLEQDPDLVNEISTGGATPLHMCGMSKQNQHSTAYLISKGGVVEAMDTYGYTPLHRMASNNLPIGAKALLDAGADPSFAGGVGEDAMEIARSSRALDVMKVLRDHGARRKDVQITKIVIAGAGVDEVNEEYVATDASQIPNGFDLVCRQQGWDSIAMWTKLNGKSPWYCAHNGAYVYWNLQDKNWWIDAPNGDGVYKAPALPHAPPQVGWISLGHSELPP